MSSSLALGYVLTLNNCSRHKQFDSFDFWLGVDRFSHAHAVTPLAGSRHCLGKRVRSRVEGCGTHRYRVFTRRTQQRRLGSIRARGSSSGRGPGGLAAVS